MVDKSQHLEEKIKLSVAQGDTLASEVLNKLRADIVACVLMPGTKLRFEGLREVYGASFSTLREALSRLASERLVTFVDRRGFIVSPISKTELLELTDARVLIECECLERTMASTSEAWRIKLLAAFHRLERTQSRLGDDFSASNAWNQEHADFHEALVSGGDSNVLLEIRKSLFERAYRYRRLSSLIRTSPRQKSDEHRELMEAALSGDVQLARHRLTMHFRDTTQNILANPTVEPYLFEELDAPKSQRSNQLASVG